jgi:hypothetical protein
MTMELSIRSRDEFYDYLESELQNAAEKGRKEGERIGRKEGEKIGRKEGEEKTVVYFYKKGLIPRGGGNSETRRNGSGI